MKTIKYLLLLTTSIVLFNACSNDESDYGSSIQEGQKITIKATIDNENPSTRAGIQEGNTDYESGESFYWTDGDQINLYFVKEGQSTVLSSSFTAENSNGQTADFTGVIPANIPDGTYTVYASKDLTQVGSTTQLKGTLSEQTQKGNSSDGMFLPMQSRPIKDIVISNGTIADPSALNFNLKQLNSLLRFTIENTTDQSLTVNSLSISLESTSGEAVNSFPSGASLNLGSESVKWDNVEAPWLAQQRLTVNQNGTESTIASGSSFDAYLSTFPSEGLGSGNKFVIQISLSDADGKNYICNKVITISNSGNFSFLNSGFEAAKRYYFIVDVNKANLQKVRNSYTVTFEDSYYDSFVVHKNWAGMTSTTEWSGWSGNRYPDWIDPVTQLSVKIRPIMVGGGTMEGYPWIVSSYNSNSLDTNTYGNYLYDLYVYNPDGSENSTTGGGNNGSNNFITTYGYMDLVYDYGDGRPILSFADKKARTIKGLYVNYTNYFLAVVISGNGLSPALAEGEDVKLVATGYDADNNETGSIEMSFATYNTLLKGWTYWDLSSLGDIVMLRINMVGGTDNGYGFSLPAYYAVDDITVEWD